MVSTILFTMLVPPPSQATLPVGGTELFVLWPLLTEGVVVVIPPADVADVMPPRTLLFLVYV